MGAALQKTHIKELVKQCASKNKVDRSYRVLRLFFFCGFILDHLTGFVCSKDLCLYEAC